MSTPSDMLDERRTPRGGEPELTQYMDYRKYLADWYSSRKAARASFSGAMFAKKANLKSHTLLGMVIRGERNLSYRTIPSFILALGLKKGEAEYFEKLVLYNQARTHAERMKYLGSFRKSQVSANPTIREAQDKSAYFSNWYVVAIRELAMLPSFQADAEWIARKLKHKITAREAEAALDLLKRLGLLSVSESGVTRSEGTIEFLPDEPHPPMQEYHLSLMRRSMEAVSGEPRDEREVESVTLAVTPEELEQIKQKMRDTLRSVIEGFVKEPKDKRHVVVVHVQTLQLTSRDP